MVSALCGRHENYSPVGIGGKRGCDRGPVNDINTAAISDNVACAFGVPTCASASCGFQRVFSRCMFMSGCRSPRLVWLASSAATVTVSAFAWHDVDHRQHDDFTCSRSPDVHVGGACSPRCHEALSLSTRQLSLVDPACQHAGSHRGEQLVPHRHVSSRIKILENKNSLAT
jgi:hypothetical protein